MGVGQFSVAAATAVVGYDLTNGAFWKQIGKHRMLTGFGLKGSAAAIDTKVELFIGTVKIGEFYNTGTGLPDNDDIVPLDGNYVPPNELIHVYVTDAPATNPINGVLTWAEM